MNGKGMSLKARIRNLAKEKKHPRTSPAPNVGFPKVSFASC